MKKNKRNLKAEDQKTEGEKGGIFIASTPTSPAPIGTPITVEVDETEEEVGNTTVEDANGLCFGFCL